MTTVSFGREICNHLETASHREWLITNGIGGFGCGTVSGLLTRRYHGYLVATLQPPLSRTLLLVKVDETADYDGDVYPLFCNHWASGEVTPQGYLYLESFHLEGTTPVWTYALQDALLQKRIWMHPGANTTYIQYRYIRPPAYAKIASPRRISLSLKSYVNYRDYHGYTHYPNVPSLTAGAVHQGIIVSPPGQAAPFYLLSSQGNVELGNSWEQDFYQKIEAARGEVAVEDHWMVGTFSADLCPGDSLTLVASTAQEVETDGERAYAVRQSYEANLAGLAQANDDETLVGMAFCQLVLTADQFIVRRSTPTEAEGSTILAGYPWFTDWGRDTMISLPGLTLATGRPQIARRILRTFAAYVDQGMLPNRFPDEGETPEYNTVDAGLWYFQAVRAYFEATGDQKLLEEIFPVLAGMISWHQQGTRYNIHVDQDGLLYAGGPGVQLTWMDVKIGDWVVTPRTGKPVEINALWYNALLCMAHFSEVLHLPGDVYHEAAARVRQSFGRYWNAQRGYLYDTLDGPDGDDPTLRPNQLLAVSLPYSPLDEVVQRAVLDACSRSLLTSFGLRSLAPCEREYRGRYEGDRALRDSAYHQGTVWAWLIGPFISAHLRVYGDPHTARSFLLPLLHQLFDHGLGSISEIYDGDAPFTPRGCPSQAWSVGEVLRVLGEIKRMSQDFASRPPRNGG